MATGTAVKGYDGRFAIGGVNCGFIDMWSFQMSADKVEKTGFGDNWRSYVQALPGGSGTFTGLREIGTNQSTVVNMFASGGTLTSITLNLTEETGAVYT